MSYGVKAGVAIGVFIMMVGMLLVPMVDATQDNATDTFNHTEGETKAVTDKLEVKLVNASGAVHDATVKVKDLGNLSTNQTKLNTSEIKDINLSGDHLTAGVISNTSSAVTYNLTYPPMFGWQGGPRLFMENMDSMLVLLGAAVIVGTVGVALND